MNAWPKQLLPALLLVVLVPGCPESEQTCGDDRDCPEGRCVAGVCIPVEEPDGQASDGDGGQVGDDGGPPGDDGGQPSDDGGASTDDGAGQDDDSPDAGDPGPADDDPPVDCGPIAAHPDWDLCDSGQDYCAGVFYDGAGCDSYCDEVGLVCGAVYEDLTGACARDEQRPELTCSPPSGHQSDWCECVRADCLPDCGGRVCGSDGCGGSCGPCADGEACVQGQCQPDATGCDQYPYPAADLYAERVGFGRNTTGGDPANVYLVTSLDNDGPGTLRQALESDADYWIGFAVEGTITLADGGTADRLHVRSNKTIDGRGRNVTIEGNLLLDEVTNVIIADVRMTNELEGHCTQAGDVVTIRGNGGTDPDAYTARDIWIHHVELFLGGDGLLDIRGGSNITISWCHLAQHKKGMLASQTADGSPAPGMRVTYHHNYFNRISLRGPQFIYGQAHYFNNYQFEWYEYGAGSLDGAQFASEANIYQARPGTFCLPVACPDPSPCGDSDVVVSKLGLVTDWGGHPLGYTRSTGDLLLEDAEVVINQPDLVFDPAAEYTYTLEPASEALAAQIAADSGPRVDYCQ